MVLDVEPVAHVAAVPVDRQALPLDRVQDHEGDELLGELVGAVVVRAVGEEGRQAVRLVVRAHEVVGARLRGRVGRVRRVGRRLREGPGRAERAVDLVGRDVQEAEAAAAASGLSRRKSRAASSSSKVPVTFVRTNEAGSSIERSTWVSAAKFTTAAGRCSRKSARTASRSAMSASHEGVARVRRHVGEALEVARVGQLVEHDHAGVGAREGVADEVAPDEPGPAGHDDRLHGPIPSPGAAPASRRSGPGSRPGCGGSPRRPPRARTRG